MKTFFPILLACTVSGLGLANPAVAQDTQGVEAQAKQVREEALKAATDALDTRAADVLQPVPAAPANTRDADPALWVVRDEDTIIYMFGTVHVLKPGLGWFDEAVKDAFDASDTLVVEVVEPPAGDMQSLFGKYALASDGVPMRKRLTGDSLAQYNAAVDAANLPHETLDPLDPWAAAVTLQLVSLVAAGYDPESGVDTQLEAAAKANGKPIGQIETVDDQLGAFDNLPMKAQIDFLDQTTADTGATAKELDALVESWAIGDTAAMADMINAGFTDPRVYRALLTRRNAKWARWVKNRMDQPGTVFLAVGAGHLTGSTSLQHLMSAYGITAERIDY